MELHKTKSPLGLGYNILGRKFVGLIAETNNDQNDRIKNRQKDHKELSNLTDLEQSSFWLPLLL